MNRSISEIQASLAAALNALPGVFSTVQWGGRAYKLPGPGSRGMKKPALLTHVCLNKAGDAVCLGFRLEKSRAKAIVKQYKWIKPHSFSTLKNTGWLETQVTTKAECRVVIALLRESRALHLMPHGDDSEGRATRKKTARRGKPQSSGKDNVVARRLDAVLRQKREEGWRPDRDG